MKRAFTLAEVLITLGIIGVVAAMTIPIVINKYRSYVLEVQFKKAYSNLSQAVLLMKQDLGVENLWKEYAVYDAENLIYVKSEDFYREFDKYIKVVKKAEKYEITNYNGTKKTISDPGFDLPKAIYILPDGSSVGRQINNGRIRFWIDVNGPYKKPNRYGFDVFEFHITPKNDAVVPVKQARYYTDEELKNEPFPYISGSPCNKLSKQEFNGVGCSWFAVNNVNPDDSTKKYWSSLPW